LGVPDARQKTRGTIGYVLGLPNSIIACLFDLDGVLTDTASVHSAAWKQTFDEFLRARDGDGFTPFRQPDDYDEYVDGKPRADGVRDFLASRGIHLPEGNADDPPGAATVNGVGNRKNVLLLAKIHSDGVRVYEGSRRYLHAARDAGLRRIVVSSSANTQDVLKVTGLDELIEGVVDGNTLREQQLPGKPAPDAFLAGAKLSGADPAQAAVFEDAIAGVQAGRDGRFGFVVGVNRLDHHHAEQLRQHGASIVVDELADLLDES
jgi:beta-phosphoglucomutase family hydrolase